MCLFLWAIVLSIPRTSAAEPPPPHREHVRFSYSAPDDCPTEDEFVARVRERSAELIDDPEAARSLSVTIAHGDTWHGELRTEGIASGQGTRAIDADSCASVVRSLAIFTAIALREGSPDELPPAHPELQKEDAADPNEGFVPMAPPPKMVPLVPDLHRDRFAFTARTSVAVVNDGGRSVGTGLGVDYFFTSSVAFGVEGAMLLDLPPALSDGDANESRARIVAHFELETTRAQGTMFGPRRGRVFDQFISLGAGAVFTRPRPEQDTLRESFPYSASFLVDPALGFRFFVDDDIAFSIQADAMFYSQPNAGKDEYGLTPDTPTLGSSTLGAASVLQIGFTWFPSRARTWDE